MSFISFDTVIRDICNAGDDPEAKHYSRVARIFKTELRNLNLLVLPTGIETRKMKVLDSLTVPLEEEVIKVDSVAYINNGKLFSMREMDVPDNEIIAGCTCDETVSPEITECPFHTYHNCCWGDTRTMYGVYTPSVVGTWRHDVNHARINVAGIPPNSFLAVKIRSKKDDLILVPQNAYKLLEAVTLATYFRSKNRGLAADWAIQADRALHYYKEQANPWDWEAMYDAMFSTAKRAKS